MYIGSVYGIIIFIYYFFLLFEMCCQEFHQINLLHFFSQVDLLSLDVEGVERRILDTLPWSSLEISVLLLEHHGDVKGKDTKFVEGVVAHGYHLYDYHIDKDNIGDYIFVKNGVF